MQINLQMNSLNEIQIHKKSTFVCLTLISTEFLTFVICNSLFEQNINLYNFMTERKQKIPNKKTCQKHKSDKGCRNDNQSEVLKDGYLCKETINFHVYLRTLDLIKFR